MVPVKGQPFVHALARREGLTMQSYFKNYESRLSASDEVEKFAFLSLNKSFELTVFTCGEAVRS